MKTIFPMAIFSLIILFGNVIPAIGATETLIEPNEIYKFKNNQSVNNQDEGTAYRQIERVLQNPQILTKSSTGILTVYPECKWREETGELSCPPAPGIQSITFQAGTAGIIDFELLPPVTCDDLYTLISKKFGAGKLVKSGDPCSAIWNIGKRVKGAYIRISKSRKQPTKIFLQIGIEQGP